MNLPPHELWPHPIRGVAFDMDGLMINTEDMYTEISQVILGRRGKVFDASLKREMMGKPAPQAWSVMIQRHSLTDHWETLQAETDELFEQLLPQRVAPMPGLLQLLHEIDQAEYPRCVATSSRRAFAERALHLSGLLHRVHFIVTAEDVQRGKPAPDIYHLAAERMGIAVENMLVLEDSLTGAAAGIAAGACVIAVPNPSFEPNLFSQAWRVCPRLDAPEIITLLSS